MEYNLLRDRCEQRILDIAFHQSQSAFSKFALTYPGRSESPVQSMWSLLASDILSIELHWCSSDTLKFISQIKLCTTEVSRSLWALIILDIFSCFKVELS
jgi:hypothetical protein